MWFTNYKQNVLTLVTALRKLQDFANKLQFDKLVGLIDELVRYIERESFSIAVVGEFKRGKSTLINALLGQEILPSDVLPCSATLSRIIYGPKPLVKLLFKDGREEEVAISQLTDYVTKLTPGSETTAASVQEAIIYYPVNYCRNNVEIIDTPGLSDDENMTAVTLSVLQRVEVVVMVISALAPFSELESEFITQNLLKNNLDHIIFVVTCIDLLRHSQDANKVVMLVKKRIKEYLGNWSEYQFGKNSEEYKVYQEKINKFKVIGLSAYQALSAKRNSDITLLTQSRIQEFESVLQKLIAQERGVIYLQFIANRLKILSTEILTTVGIKKSVWLSKQEELKNNCEAINNKIIKFRQIKTQEFLRISAINETIKLKVKPLIYQLDNNLKQVADHAIEAAYFNPSDGTQALVQQFASQVSDAIQTASQRLAGEIEAVIRRELSTAAKRIQVLAESAPEVISSLEMQLTQIPGNTVYQASSMLLVRDFIQAFDEFNQNHSTNLLTLFDCSSQVFMFEDNPSGLYTIIGGAVGTFFGPLGTAVGAAVGAKVGGNQRVKNFKVNYKQKVTAEIERQLQSHNINQIVDDYIDEACSHLEKLKKRIYPEISSSLDKLQGRLAQIRGNQQALIENECKALDTMQTEVQKIINNARDISEQLVEIMEVDTNSSLEQRICRNCDYRNDSSCRYCIKCGTQLN